MRDTDIPQLRRKFRLLVEYGQFANLEEIANALGKTSSAIKTWADGNERWETGHIPKSSYENVIQLFGDAISRHHNIQDIEAVIKGRVTDLEALLKPPSPFTLSILIEREGITNCGKLIEFPDELNAVETSNAPHKSTDFSIKQGQGFRISFSDASISENILVLQNAKQSWVFGFAALDNTKMEILVPGFNDDGTPASMREHQWTGPNQFIAVQTSAPFPRKILVAIQEGLQPDSVLIQELAEFFAAQPIDERKLYILSVQVNEVKKKQSG